MFQEWPFSTVIPCSRNHMLLALQQIQPEGALYTRDDCLDAHGLLCAAADVPLILAISGKERTCLWTGAVVLCRPAW
jgi:hypothetical protein